MMKRASLALFIIALFFLASAASAHHLGAYVPKDDKVTTSFRRLKIYVEKGKFNLARQEFNGGEILRQMAAIDKVYGDSLAAQMGRALTAEDLPGSETALLRFFAYLVRDRLAALLKKLDGLAADGKDPRVRSALGLKILGGAWLYYNLVDFAFYKRDVKTVLQVRLAFEDMAYFLGEETGKKGIFSAKAYDEAKLRQRLAELDGLLAKFLNRNRGPDEIPRPER